MTEKSDIRIVRGDGEAKLFHISNGPIAAEILRDTTAFSKRDLFFYAAIKRIGTENIVAAESGSFWRELHNHLIKKFTPAAMKDFASLVLKKIDDATERWIASGKPFNVEEEMRYLTGSIIGRYLFSDDITEDELKGMISAVTELPMELNLPTSTADNPFVLMMRGGVLPQNLLSHSQQELLDYMNGVLQKVFARRDARVDKPNDLLELLLGYSADRSTLVRDNALVFFVAGQETISVTLTMAMREILAHPEEIRKIRDEVNAIPGGVKGLAEHFNQLIRTQNILKEVMRLHPSAPMLHRSVTQDRVIKGVQQPFQKGDAIIVDIRRIHRNPQHWSDPNTFKPERFEGALTKDTYLPFSTGERICLGGPMAMTEGVISLAKFFSAAQVVLEEDTITPQRTVVITARPVGSLHVSFHRG